MIECGIPRGLCQCGCGRKTTPAIRNLKDRGYVKGEPLAFIAGHSPAKSQEFKEAVFWSQMRILANGCWQWIGAVDEKGYGKTCTVESARSKPDKAHRVAYKLVGGAIPEGKELDHTCRNRACINPLHLEPVTHLVNMQRSANMRLTPDQIQEILSTPRGRLLELPDRFGVTIHTVYATRTRYKKRAIEDRME